MLRLAVWSRGLAERRKELSEAQAQDALRALGKPAALDGKAKEELKNAILDAGDEAKVRDLEGAMDLAEED